MPHSSPPACSPWGSEAACTLLPLQSPALLLNSHFLRFSSLCNTNLSAFTFLKEPDFQLPFAAARRALPSVSVPVMAEALQSGLVPPLLVPFQLLALLREPLFTRPLSHIVMQDYSPFHQPVYTHENMVL